MNRAGLHLFRSRLFALLIATLVLLGYSAILGGACCPESSITAASADKTPGCSSESDHSGGDICHCLCHQTLAAMWTTPSELVVLTVLAIVSEWADKPPESLPLGIDYPPQLA